MKNKAANHPCFNEQKRHSHGRVHLPVAPRCNLQCNYCNRKYDCHNESRPGVTSSVLDPYQAVGYLEQALKSGNISVVGIAGPGDPFANPEETLKTLRMVRSRYPDLLLCVATNGLNIGPYIDALIDLDVTHVTITVNAVRPEIGKKIYAFAEHGERRLGPYDGATLLIEKQQEAIACLAEHDVIVKVNTIIIPGINDGHIEEIARNISELNADIMNCMPYYRNSGCAFGSIPEPTPDMMAGIRKKAGTYMKLMNHCKRCRADAAGLLDERHNGELEKYMRQSKAAACTI